MKSIALAMLFINSGKSLIREIIPKIAFSSNSLYINGTFHGQAQEIGHEIRYS